MGALRSVAADTQFTTQLTCFTSTNVQILTAAELQLAALRAAQDDMRELEERLGMSSMFEGLTHGHSHLTIYIRSCMYVSYVCMHICMYVCIIYVYIFFYIYTHIHIYIYIHTYRY